ncbi:hypothetical protein XELAEV_18008190mg [Xenopus laevis]|uniref:Uncharacterized protein n=1 Tax=Xenopus laevis TaxID=8355 RepID=A0A974E484_XENLA|nr:hypothetical protein XELAEV_18008190mg [Xenopus laevis]
MTMTAFDQRNLETFQDHLKGILHYLQSQFTCHLKTFCKRCPFFSLRLIVVLPLLLNFLQKPCSSSIWKCVARVRGTQTTS